MPIYEYRCESCGETLEKIQKFSDPPLTDCPACGKPTLKKLVSASSFRLKGSGWYETDFKTKKKPVNEGGNNSKSSADSTNDKSDKPEKSGKDGKSGSATGSDKSKAASND